MRLTTRRLAFGHYVVEDPQGSRWNVRRQNLAWVGTLTALGEAFDHLEARTLDDLKSLIAEAAERRLLT